MRKILPEEFFARPAPIVARDLIGKYLVRKVSGREIGGMIVETEGYHGTEDLASHASKGRTKRTEIMFGKPGRCYVYLIYGMYSMLNIVTHEEDYPSAVLIRSLDTVDGPGRLTKFLSIDQSCNTLKAGKKSNLWFEDRGIIISSKDIEHTPRVGVEYAGPRWGAKPWRFIYKAHKKTMNL